MAYLLDYHFSVCKSFLLKSWWPSKKFAAGNLGSALLQSAEAWISASCGCLWAAGVGVAETLLAANGDAGAAAFAEPY